MTELEDLLVQQFHGYSRGLGAEVSTFAGIVPPQDFSTLFLSAGIQLYRSEILARTSNFGFVGNCQWCVKTNRIKFVGSGQWLTSFRMLTNLVPGQLSREEHLCRTIEFFKQYLGLDQRDLRFTVSKGINSQTDDKLSLSALKSLGVESKAIKFIPRPWASPFGVNGPTGPNLLISVYFSSTDTELHLWNLEFLDYWEYEEHKYSKMDVPLVDSAGNLETACSVKSGFSDIYQSGSLQLILQQVEKNFSHIGPLDQRVITDHIRTIGLLLRFNIKPSAKKQGYIARRLIKRVLTLLEVNDIDIDSLRRIYGTLNVVFPSLCSQLIDSVFVQESELFQKCLRNGKKQLYRMIENGKADDNISLNDIRHYLMDTTGVPEPIAVKWTSETDNTLA